MNLPSQPAEKAQSPLAMSQPNETRWEKLAQNLRTIGGAVLLALVIRTCLFEAFEIEGPSMEPTLLNGDRVVVARTEEGYAAFEDRCTHKGGPLSDGTLICGTVQCPWHGSQFDVHSGEVKCGPATEPIAVVKTLSLPPAPESR